MRGATGVANVEEIVTAAFETDLTERWFPIGFGRIARDRGYVERAVRWKISEEVTGIDIDGADHTRESQADDAPVVTGRALAARLPTVHPFSAVGVFVWNEDRFGGFEQVFFWREEVVTRCERDAADEFGSEIDQAREHWTPFGVPAKTP